jgi:hypothetical protein
VYWVFQAWTKQFELQKVDLYRELRFETHWRPHPVPPSANIDQS